MAEAILRVLPVLRARLAALCHAPWRDTIATFLREAVVPHLGEALLVGFALVTLAALLALMVL